MEALRYMLLGIGLFLLAIGCAGILWSNFNRLRRRRAGEKPSSRSQRDELDEELGEALKDLEAFRSRFQVVPEAPRAGVQPPLAQLVVLKSAMPLTGASPVAPLAPLSPRAEPEPASTAVAESTPDGASDTAKPDAEVDNELLALFEEAETHKAAPAPIRDAIEAVDAAELLAEARAVRDLMQPKRPGRAA